MTNATSGPVSQRPQKGLSVCKKCVDVAGSFDDLIICEDLLAYGRKISHLSTGGIYKELNFSSER